MAHFGQYLVSQIFKWGGKDFFHLSAYNDLPTAANDRVLSAPLWVVSPLNSAIQGQARVVSDHLPDHPFVTLLFFWSLSTRSISGKES